SAAERWNWKSKKPRPTYQRQSSLIAAAVVARPRRRKFAAHGLYQREIHGRWLQSLESGRIANDKITGASWGGEIAPKTAESKLSADGLIMAESAFPHELRDRPGNNKPA